MGKTIDMFTKREVETTVRWPAAGFVALAAQGRISLSDSAAQVGAALEQMGVPKVDILVGFEQLTSAGLVAWKPTKRGDAEGAVRRVWEAWSKALMRARPTKRIEPKLTADRAAHIRARLREYTEQVLLDAVDGFFADEWWRERIERAELDHCMSNGARLERYAEAGRALREAAEVDAVPDPLDGVDQPYDDDSMFRGGAR